MGANGSQWKPETVEGAGSGETIGWSFPGARPIKTRTEEPGSQWTAPPGGSREKEMLSPRLTRTWRFVKGIGTAAAQTEAREEPLGLVEIVSFKRPALADARRLV